MAISKNSKRSFLENFLFAAKNSHAKESLINNRLLFDLKLAAAKRGYFLNAYAPEVDQDGFDVIFDDQDRLAKIQLKTVMKGASTATWKIHKRLLRPTLHTHHEYGFEASPEGCGYEGGIVLMEVDASSGFNIKYFYTDITILCAFRDKILRVKNPPTTKVIERVFRELHKGGGSEKIGVPKSMFLAAHDPASLLALMGLHNSVSGGYWKYHLMCLIEPAWTDDKLPASATNLIDCINNELLKLSPRVKKCALTS